MNLTLLRTRAADLVATTALVASVASFALLHLLMGDVVDPVSTPVSMYALTAPGTVLFPVGALGLALACTVLAGRGTGLPHDRFARSLLGATALMLVLATLFRSGTPESGLTVAAQIHRYSAGAAFVMLTVVAAWCTARLRRSDAARMVRLGLWWVTVLATLTFATTTLNTFLPGLADGGQWRGLPQRFLLLVLTGLVGLLIAHSRPAASPAGVSARVPAVEAPGAPALAGAKP